MLQAAWLQEVLKAINLVSLFKSASILEETGLNGNFRLC